MKKFDSIVKLQLQGCNTHICKLCRDRDEVMREAEKYGTICTIREDTCIGQGLHLPFYTGIDNLPEKPQKGEAFIYSNGKQFDDFLLFNGKITLEQNGDFKGEVSSERVTLREMHNYPLTYVEGNIAERLSKWKCIGAPLQNKDYLHDYLYTLYELGIFKQIIESTYYNCYVGIHDDKYVIWEVI